jgi:hypothetical protein
MGSFPALAREAGPHTRSASLIRQPLKLLGPQAAPAAGADPAFDRLAAIRLGDEAQALRALLSATAPVTAPPAVAISPPLCRLSLRAALLQGYTGEIQGYVRQRTDHRSSSPDHVPLIPR